MGQDSKIEWTNHTANLWWGCTEVHCGCLNCYARMLAKRFGFNIWGKDKPRLLITSVWKDLEKYQRVAEREGKTELVFVNSMSDIFEKPMPLINWDGDLLAGLNNPELGYSCNSKDGDEPLTTKHIRDRFFEQIDAGKYPNLVFLLLTKRPSNINKYIPERWKENPPANVMFGTSPVNQETYDKLVSQLLEVKGNKFLNVEPQLDFITIAGRVKGIDWIIQGGESGPKRRPFDLEWARQLKQECAHFKIPYFFKQIDKVKEIPSDLLIREFPRVSENVGFCRPAVHFSTDI